MQHLTAQQRKKEGAHYTPRALAVFVARQICNAADIAAESEGLRVLDPAVGDGELLYSLLTEIQARKVLPVVATAFDTDLIALEHADKRLSSCALREGRTEWRGEDFLEYALAANGDGSFGPLFSTGNGGGQFDLAIANPPYVRTQVLGQRQAQDIARRFGLQGRIDLYHAFLLGIAEVLKPGGVAGVIVSNRFLSTQAGVTVRTQLLERYDLIHVWDLGDTKLFEAAVLPAVLLLRKKGKASNGKRGAKFTSVYSCANDQARSRQTESIFDVVEDSGRFVLPDATTVCISQGRLDPGSKSGDVWRLSNTETDAWLRCVDKHTGLRFGDVGKIRVGVKTTADKVFIRSDWRELPASEQPELLKPLITHHVARSFKAKTAKLRREILYTHQMRHGRKKPVDLSSYPRAEKYLELHRDQLEARKYVREAGREWFEIWVPQDPSEWKRPKLVFRDISKEPTFWMDLSGAIVNGDCYWMTAASPEKESLLWVAVGVANSRFIEAYYDAKYNNKLYAGRRRFMTQYVEAFPLPPPESKCAREIEECSRAIYDGLDRIDCTNLLVELDEVVAGAFGLGIEEVTG